MQGLRLLSCLALLIPAGSARAEPADPGATAIDAAGASFPAAIAGEGEPVVFVHGSFSDLRVWNGLAAEVTAGRRFIGYTQRGFGTGTWPDTSFSRDLHTRDLEAILAALGDPAALVGWSYGGPIVLRAAAEVPDRVSAVVVYEPTVPEILGGSPDGEAVRDQWFGIWADTDAAVKAGDYPEAIREGIEAALGLPEGGFATQPPELQAMQLENAHTMPLDWGAPMPTPITCDELGTIKAPTLVITGSDTHPGWTAMGEAIAACIPDAELLVLDGAGHGGPLAAKDAFLAAALGFIDAH